MTSPRQSAVTFTLPASFQPAEFLAGKLALRADDARWLVSTILTKTANRDTDIWGMVRLHSDILRRIMDKHSATRVCEALVAGGAIETAPYCSGVKSKGFRLAARYLGDRCIRVNAMDSRLIERVRRERDRLDGEEQRLRWKPVHHQLAEEQQRVSLDGTVDDLLDHLPDHTRLCQHVLVQNIQQRRPTFSVSTTGRVFNGITGLRRTLRPALRIDGRQVGSVDIRCAQPGLLAMMLTQKPPSAEVKYWATYKVGPWVSLPCPLVPVSLTESADVAALVTLVTEGSLYEHLVCVSGLSREDVKHRVLVDVLAKRGRYPSQVEQIFRQQFPSVYRAIKLINRHDHGELIRLLQRAESNLVVERVAPRLLAAGCRAVTLHDAIFSPADSLSSVEAAFMEEFASFGFRLALKAEVHLG